MTNVTLTDLVDSAVAIEDGTGLVEEMKSNWWKDLVRFTLANFDPVRDSAEEPSAMLKDTFEAAYRAAKGEDGKPMKGGMPGWYRSNKSTIKGAYEYDVMLTDGEGLPRGKTEVSNDIAAKKDVKTVDEKITALASTISTLLDKGEHNKAVVELLDALHTKAVSSL